MQDSLLQTACCTRRAAQRLLGGQFNYRLAAQQLDAAAQAVRSLSTAAAQAKAGAIPAIQRISSNSSSNLKPSVPQLPAYLTAAGGDAAAAAAVAVPVIAGAAASAAAAADASVAAAAAGWPGVLADLLSPLARFYDQEDGWQDLGAFSQVGENAFVIVVVCCPCVVLPKNLQAACVHQGSVGPDKVYALTGAHASLGCCRT